MPDTSPIPPVTVPEAAEEASEWLPDGLIVVTGPGQVIDSINSPAERITGLRRDEVLGQPVRAVWPLRDRDGHSWWDLANPWQGLNTRSGHREKLLFTGLGREVLVTARYIRGQHLGPVDVVVLSVRDAEGRRRVEAQQAALISTLAHELRSPLTGVKGFSSTLLRHWDRFTDAQKRLMLETIETDADRVTRLITELLDVSRLDSGRLRVHRQVVNPSTLLQRAVERVAVQGISADRFVFKVADPDLEVWADPDRLEQVISNLVDNALAHGEGTIELSVHQRGDGVVALGVADEGPGIPEAQRNVVFQKFWHGPNAASTGLGLYLVRGLVEAHGGRITVGDRAGGGAAFIVELEQVVD